MAELLPLKEYSFTLRQKMVLSATKTYRLKFTVALWPQEQWVGCQRPMVSWT